MRAATEQPEAFLHRLGRGAHDRRWLVLVGWVVVLVALGGATGSAGGGFSTEFSLPDVESARGFDVLDERFGGAGSGITGRVVLEAPGGVTDPAVRRPLADAFDEIDAADDVRVESPFDPQNPLADTQVSPDGTIAFANVEFGDDVNAARGLEVAEQIRRGTDDINGVRVELGGDIFREFEPPESELLGLAFAVVILIISFGSVIAMGLPIGTALAGIGVGITAVTLVSNLVEMPEFTTTIAVMIGLGVGIDYALFIVTRFREELGAGADGATAAGVAIDTAGRAVLFAGTTVVISLLGLLVIGLAFVRGLAIGAATVVAVTMLASVTLLPALLGFVGQRVEVTRWRGVAAAGLVALGLVGLGLGLDVLLVTFPVALVVLVAGVALQLGGVERGPGRLNATLPRRRTKPLDETLAYRWSRLIQRRPWVFLGGGGLALVLLALPVLSLRLGFTDASNLPEDNTGRQAYDLLAEGFGPGFNGPAIVVAELGAAGPEVIGAIDDALRATSGVAFVSPARPDDPTEPAAAVWQVIPETAPQAEATDDLVKTLRGDVLDTATSGTGADALVTGSVAVDLDFSTYLGERLPYFFAAVLSLSFLLLMAVFRSVLVPLKAVLMNLLSIGSAYGLTVAVFQWGWGASLFGVSSTGPIEPFLPMMLFAIVFGLSMDYEVFLLSRIREQYDRGASNAEAVADGLAQTARVITAAAAIMVFVFGAFLLESDRIIKVFGFGLATAILLDATVVRMLLVPATMELLGDRNWWLPRFLDRLLPTVDIDGADAGGNRPDDPSPGDDGPESSGDGTGISGDGTGRRPTLVD